MTDTDSLPRLLARTQHFALGRPRSFVVAPDGSRVWFTCSDAGDDRVHHLWLLDVGDEATSKVADGRGVRPDDARTTAAEQARRERAREQGTGIVSFATDHAARRACFVVRGRVHVVDAAGALVTVDTAAGAHDPRLSPDGRRVAMVVDRGMHVADLPLDETDTLVAGAVVAAHPLVTSDDDTVSWGLAEFVAAEEIGRRRGFWWQPDGRRLLVARVDEAAVTRAWLADPVAPERRPRRHRYPFAGTANATVDLFLVEVPTDGHASGAGETVAVGGDRDHYLAAVTWPGDGTMPAVVTWQDRAQRVTTMTTLDANAATCTTRHVRRGVPWTGLVPGAPTWLGQRLVWVDEIADHGPGGTTAVVVDGEVVSPAGLQVRSIVAADDGEVVVTCSRGDATSIEVVAVDVDTGVVRGLVTAPGVHAATSDGGTRVETSTTMDRASVVTVVTGARRIPLCHHAHEPPDDLPPVALHEVAGGLHTGVVLPPGPGPFPVLLAPYGGPHAQRVLQSRTRWLVAQWFATQGLAVVVTDGRGSPGRSPAFEHAVAGDLATAPLADQVAALDAVLELYPSLDGDRVGIRGWSFGGYLAALAALRRPDRFRAAVVGAPVTDWRLYDTHYTERYLGDPAADPDAYRRSSLVDADGALVDPAAADEPAAMLVIHGLVDDNVLAAHSLRLSRALLAAGRHHQFLPLSGVTHMTPQEDVALHLLTTQLAFLCSHLAG